MKENANSVSGQPSLQCMEVWGGCGTADCHFVRPGLDVWVWSQSLGGADSGGSDVRLVSSCASGRITRMLLADVCGLSEECSEVATQLRDIMKRNVNTISQQRVVHQLSEELDVACERGAYAAAMLGTYFSPTRSLALCNAGSPPPLIYRASDRHWSILRPAAPLTRGHVSGATDQPGCENYHHITLQLQIGDLVMMFNNCWAECQDTRGRILGIEGLLELVRQLDPGRPAELAGHLIKRLQRQNISNLAADDATLFACQATTTVVDWKDNLLAPVRLLGSVADRTNLGT